MVMTARMWTRKDTQATIKDFRKHGYDVLKKGDGFYKCFVDGELVFSALVWNKTHYIVRFKPELFEMES